MGLRYGTIEIESDGGGSISDRIKEELVRRGFVVSDDCDRGGVYINMVKETDESEVEFNLRIRVKLQENIFDDDGVDREDDEDEEIQELDEFFR